MVVALVVLTVRFSEQVTAAVSRSRSVIQRDREGVKRDNRTHFVRSSASSSTGVYTLALARPPENAFGEIRVGYWG